MRRRLPTGALFTHVRVGGGRFAVRNRQMT